MYNLEKHTVNDTITIRDALLIIDKQGLIANVLFVVSQERKLLGSVTEGDIRRALLRGETLATLITAVMRQNCKYLYQNFDVKDIEELRNINITFVPIVNQQHQIIEIIEVNKYQPKLPVHAIIMAGGKGQRLLPLTKTTPKPLLRIGDKPIIEYNIDRLAKSGVTHIHISINYLGEQIQAYFKDGKERGLDIKYLVEKEFLGTIASVKLTQDYQSDTLLIMNSDLLTNINFTEFYQAFLKQGADMAIASTSYHVDVPYGVIEVNAEAQVNSLKEKPRYTYYSNAGIYLIKKELINLIPDGEFYNITDLIERLLMLNKKVISFPILGYWLDIGKHEDFKKAQEDIKYLNLN
ncbi:NTP transferase domain-containing protein [Pedobacter aquae]|uniref:NTP transferase domain-containing protein n=1 Tax=Pedobacter aquae TaxID=2605747 RepID=A0A5C0VJF7_9SPHI|nr:nucleotidyltransferase family protein [Pedobacter aquae]QEK52217.1 NTP transferase domain-containing protein [Pedobacter aquae]